MNQKQVSLLVSFFARLGGLKTDIPIVLLELIYKFQKRYFKFSEEYKGKAVILYDNNLSCKFDNTVEYGMCRAEQHINNNSISYISYKIILLGRWNFMGIVSNGVTVKRCNEWPCNSSSDSMYCYGLATNKDYFYCKTGYINLEDKGLTHETLKIDDIIHFKFDFMDIQNKKMIIQINNNKNNQIKIELPNGNKINNQFFQKWYPCVGLYRKQSQFQIL